MTRQLAVACGIVAFLASTRDVSAADAPRPNIVFILADDLGYGDLGCYGQQVIRTPRLDRMAAEGMKFRQFYAGTCVCAPSRCVLMTGRHMGHAHVRGNASGDLSIQSLRPEDVTVAEVLKSAGYTTGLCGKWGLGDELPGSTMGVPTEQGFDFFYGYLNQVHAHNYCPEFLWRNREKVPLKNEVHTLSGGSGGFAGGYATKKVEYSQDLIADQALQFIRDHKQGPFFLYFASTLPHANNEAFRELRDGTEVPDYGEYDATEWPNPDKGQAAMISRLDRDVGRLLDLLQELGIDEQTVVMFTSDNGPHQEGGQNTDRFDPNGPARGFKRDLYEAGIREPMIVRWPGTTPAGTVSDHVGYFGDLMATVAELSGARPPEGLDSISFAPEITGRHAEQKQHEFLYWEFYERGGIQAVRKGDWKAVRNPMKSGSIELYDLSGDLGEANNIAAAHPDIVREMERRMAESHVDHPAWQPRGTPQRPASPPGDGQPRF
jgi:arylsulfatase A-like enzyme